MRPVSVCATSASGPSTSNLGLGFGVASAAAAACCARPLPALAAAACSRPLHRHPSLTSGAPGTGLSGAASARQHHRSAATLVASALKRPGAAAGTDGGTDGSSGGGGGLVRSRSSRTTLTRSAPAADVVAAAAPQAEPHGQPQRRLRRRTETQAVEPGAPAGGPAATATATTATTTAAHFTSSSTDYTAWKVSELQEALAAHGLPRTGRKAELVERLAAAVASGAAAGAGSRSALASSAPAAAGPSVAAAAAAAAEVAAPLPRQRSRLTVARSTATADFENGRGAAAAAPSGTAGRAGRAAAAATAATANAAVKQGSSDAESGAASGGFLDALFDTLTLDITVREQRPGRRPRPATTDGAAARSPSASRAGSTAADSPPAQSSRTAAAAGRGTDSLGSVRLDLGGEGDDEPAAQPAAAAAEAASEAAGEARPRRLTIRRERTSDAGDTRPMASAAAVAPTPAPALPTPVAAEGPPERPRREPRPPVGPAPDLSQLPPWPPQFLGRLRRLEEVAPGEIEKQEEAVLQNVQGLALTCLGSAPCLATRAAAAVAGAAGEDRALGSLALARGKDIFIFDVGDDTQRQVGQAYHVKPSKIFRIFLTSLAPEAVLGLPGLMCTINASRERGHEFADIPVHVYGPPGTAAFLVAMMRVSQTYLEITVVVHEFAVGHVSAAELAPIVGGGGGGSGPIAVDKNRRISRLALPPDQLNPRGGVDASLLTFAPEQGRAQRRKGRNASGGVLSFDARAGYLPWPELQPGDPDSSRRELPDPLSLTWTLELDVSGRVVACLLPAAPGQPGAFGGGGDGQSYVLAYTVVEADRSGALVMERAAAAGLEGGPDFARLKQGETIANAWGQPIPPELIISPKRAGRRVVVTGSAADLTPLTAHAHTRGADILVPGAVWLQAEADAAAEHGGCTTAAVGAAAAALGVRYVVLSRFSGPSATAAAGAAAAAAAAAAGATAEQGLQDEEEDELPMDAHTNRLVAEVEAAALAAAGGSAAAGSSGNEAAASTGASRRRSVRKTAVVAGAGAGGSGYAGAAVAGHRLRRVLVLRDLETTMMEKNEGPMEPQEE